MRTEFVTFVHSVYLSTLDRFNPYDNSVKEVFCKCWDKSLKEYSETYPLTDSEIYKYSIHYDGLRVIGGNNLHSLIFTEDIELPKENFTFLQLLQKNCKDKELVIVVMDKITREREIFD